MTLQNHSQGAYTTTGRDSSFQFSDTRHKLSFFILRLRRNNETNLDTAKLYNAALSMLATLLVERCSLREIHATQGYVPIHINV